ncbi:anti sigma-E factor RseA C-terminal domain-containing protein, partial [Salmonella enterica]|uniref:anti sigma-E factor RseA C-terminal domain-containing protein n=1 Tax=Salmonella enterica TaxID=28901 RepID=UPI00398C4573
LQVAPANPATEPATEQMKQMPMTNKRCACAGECPQIDMASCVSLAVIFGVQHYNGQSETSQQPETPVFNTLPMMGKASPVSLGVPSEAAPVGSQQQQVQEQRLRINTMSQDFELQRRPNSEPLQFSQA